MAGQARRLRSSIGMSAAVLASVIVSGAASAQSPGEFFKDRQLTLLIGGGPGGSVDLYSRMLSRHIVRYLPGGPTVVAKNLPSAGGVQAYMTLGSTAPRDGSTFASSARGPLTDPILSGTPAAYDPRKFIWIGAMSDDSSLCFTGPRSNVKTLDDARKAETTMAATGALAESAKFPLGVNAVAATKFKVIAGYKGASNTKLAVERGEVDGQCATFGSILATQPHVLKGEYNLLIQVGEQPHPAAPKVPLAGEFAKTKEDRQLLDILIKPLMISSSFVLPEGVPADRARVWRDAFQRTLRDHAFLEEAKSLGLDVTPRTGDEVQNIVEDLYAVPASAVERAREVFGYNRP